MSAIDRPDAEPLTVEEQLELAQAEIAELRRRLTDVDGLRLRMLRTLDRITEAES